MLLRPLSLAVLLASICVAGSAAAASWTACVDSNDWAPFTYPDHDGLLQTLVRRAAAHVGDRVEFVALPWKRCEAEVAEGLMQAAVGAPGAQRTAQLLVFPRRGGELDSSRALVTTPQVLLTPSGSTLHWDGRHLRGLQGAVLYVMGYEDIEERLKLLNLPADGGAATNELNVRKLFAGRSNAMVTYRGDAERLLRRADLMGRLEMLTPPFGEYPYYLVVGPETYRLREAEVERLWNAIREVRDSAEYRELLRSKR